MDREAIRDSPLTAAAWRNSLTEEETTTSNKKKADSEANSTAEAPTIPTEKAEDRRQREDIQHGSVDGAVEKKRDAIQHGGVDAEVGQKKRENVKRGEGDVKRGEVKGEAGLMKEARDMGHAYQAEGHRG